MTSIARADSVLARPARVERTPFVLQVSMMTWRTLTTILRSPAELLPAIVISIFFLFVYNASLGDASRFLPGLVGQSYLAFILPVSVVSTALSGGGVAGQSIVRDIESGYFDKLLLTPISRAAMLLGPMIAGALVLGFQTALILGLALLMGLESATGFVGILAVLGIAMLLGTAFGGFTVAIALRSGSAAATQGASFMFFPLTFLTATFVPITLLSGWIKTAATYNPITYVLEAMRGLLMQSSVPADAVMRGMAACLVLAAVTFTFAITSLRARTRRR